MHNNNSISSSSLFRQSLVYEAQVNCAHILTANS